MRKEITFGVSDELKSVEGQKVIGDIKKYLCYEEELRFEEEYRAMGIAREVCEQLASEKKDCSTCKKECSHTNKYFIKGIEIQELQRKRRQMGKEEFFKSKFYVHMLCMQQERKLVNLLRDTLVSAYLLPPQYVLNIHDGEGYEKQEWKGTAYPYRGKKWAQVLRICEGDMDQKELFLLKERIIFQLLYGIKDLHQLPGNLVHRDLKPSNITIERLGESYSDEILVSIIDWDWVKIGQDEKDPFSNICGGTIGYAHPKSFMSNQDNVLKSIPAKRWDYYSAALTMYYLLEDRPHFSVKEQYWNNNGAFMLKEMPNTRKYLEESLLDTEKSQQCYIQLRKILQKLLGENNKGDNQYKDIQEAIDDFQQYLLLRYGRSHCKDFQPKYFLSNDDFRYYVEELTYIYCRFCSTNGDEEFHYVLAKKDAATITINGEDIAVIYSIGERTLQGILLSSNWKWEKEEGIQKHMNHKECLIHEDGCSKLEISYAQF